LNVLNERKIEGNTSGQQNETTGIDMKMTLTSFKK